MSIFYKITAPTGSISYLFGTLHQNDTEFVTLPLEIKDAFEQATDCVFEADINHVMDNSRSMYTLATTWQNAQTQYLTQIPQDYILSATRNLKKIRDKEVNANVNPLMVLQFDYMIKNIQLTPPVKIAQAMIAENAQPTDPAKMINILDQQLMRYAKLKNKTISYLESPEDQFTVVQGYNLNMLEQIEFYHFIESELAKGKKFPSAVDVERAYRHQNIQKSNDLLQVFPTTKSIPEPVRRYYDELSVNRDLKMAEGMKSYLEHGNAFVAVGAAHLKGIIDKLQTEKYTIEAIPLEPHCLIDGATVDADKIAAFRQIYTALYMAQTSFFKERGFIPIDDTIVSFKQIQNYITANQDTRSHIAWDLAERHYKNISSNNNELLKSICQEGYAKSSSLFGLFRQTKTNLDNAQSVAEASPETRTGTVRDILNGSSI